MAFLAPAAVPAALGVLGSLPQALLDIDDTYDWVYEETGDRPRATKAATKAAIRALGRSLVAGVVAGAGGIISHRINRSLGHLVDAPQTERRSVSPDIRGSRNGRPVPAAV